MTTTADTRKESPEFCNEYAMQQHFRSQRQRHSIGTVMPTPVPKQKRLPLSRIKRFHFIQMADLPKYHYEVWADFDCGRSELLQVDYVRGLSNAVQMAFAKWGVNRIEIDRAHGAPHRSLSVLYKLKE